MSDIHEQLSAQFYLWELRGRGWQTFDSPVHPEPAYRPFEGHYLPPTKVVDDVRRDSLFERFLSKVKDVVDAKLEEDNSFQQEEPEVSLWERKDIAEVQLVLPVERRFQRTRIESLLLLFSACKSPISFEIVATQKEVVIQFAADANAAAFVRSQIESHFPELETGLSNTWLESEWERFASYFAFSELGLAKEFMLPLASPKTDWFVGLVSAMSDLENDEIAVFQVLFQPVQHPWAESMMTAVSDGEGNPFFRNRSDLLDEARLKICRPLFAVVPRIVAAASTKKRAWNIVENLVSSIGVLAKHGGNQLVPLACPLLNDIIHEEDFLRRQTHRWGALLNLEELATLVHLPDESVSSQKLRVNSGKTHPAKAAPAVEGGLFLGWNDHMGFKKAVTLSVEQRVRHMHVIGGTGTGKSTFLFNLIKQDIDSGNGLALLDPHGDLVDQILGSIPDSRIADVVLVDASDETHSVGLNILTANAEFEKTLLASDLVSVFQRLSSSWGDQMAVVFRNAILAFLERPEGGTLADVQRFLLESDFRAQVLSTVTDPDVVYYWKKGFPLLSGAKSIGPILTRLQTFLSPKPIRYMVSQRENRLDFSEITDSGKILLIKLPQGLIGNENSYLLGSLIVSKLQQAAMARQRQAESNRRLFTLYVDEFQNFITPSMAEILSGTRKYKFALILAHQELEQLSKNDAVGSAVRANAGTRVVFRVGENDARELARGFAHFDETSLTTISTGQAIVRVERSDQDFNLAIPPPSTVDGNWARQRAHAVVELSRSKYARSRSEIEAERAVDLRVSDTPIQKAPAKAAKPQTVESPTPPALTAELPQLPPKPEPVPVEAPPPPQPTPKPYAPAALREEVETLGKGGEVHKAAQIELKQLAEGLGFRAIIERQIPGTSDTIDLYLERDGIIVACEVTVTNTLDYELKNIAKSLRAGFPYVVAISVDETKASRLDAAVKNSLPTQDSARVRVLYKPHFAVFLQSLVTRPAPSPEGTKQVKGWKVKTTAVEITEEEARAREQSLAETLAENLRRKRTQKKKPE